MLIRIEKVDEVRYDAISQEIVFTVYECYPTSHLTVNLPAGFIERRELMSLMRYNDLRKRWAKESQLYDYTGSRQEWFDTEL